MSAGDLPRWVRRRCPVCGGAYLSHPDLPAPVCAGPTDHALIPPHDPTTTVPLPWPDEETP